jgi:hypothetical protein
MLSPSPYLQQSIGIFGLLYLSQEFFCLAVNPIHDLLIGIGHPVALQNGLSWLAENASLDSTKPQSMDE